MIAAVGSRFVILLFGTLYPAYASYKAVRNKDVKAYVQWMMYWIVFALFTCVETFSDVFLSFWVPFYYELKVVIVFWLLSPATKGSSLLYRKFVHPTLTEREREIDEYLAKMREKSYSTMLELGSKGINYALQTAIKGGGGLVNQLRKSYSLSDLSDRTDGAGDQVGGVHQQAARRRVPPQLDDSDDMDLDEVPMVGGAHRGYSPRRSASGSGRVEMYFPAVDVEVRRQKGAAGDSTANSGSVTSDGVDSGLEVENEPLIRTASLSSTRTSTRVRRTVTSPTSTATSPGARTKSVAAVAEDAVVEPAIAPQLTPGAADLDSEPDSDSLTSPLTSEQVTVVPLYDRAPSPVDPPMVDASDQLPGVSVDNSIANLPTQNLCNNLSREQNLANHNSDDHDLKMAVVLKSDVTNLPIEETQNLQTEIYKEIETNFVEVKSEPFLCETDEETISTLESERKVENIEITEPEAVDHPEPTVTENDLVTAEPINTNLPDKETRESSNVLVTVEVTMPTSECQTSPMVVRMSMESLPTSSQAAQALDSNIPVTVVNYEEEEVSRKSSCDSLASCSLPGTPTVSRSSSRVSEDGRAGRYNKRVAPPRPNTESTPSPDPKAAFKARLVLQPGMVRSLPEAKGEASEVFLAANKDKRKKKQASGGLSSIFPFWHTKPDGKEKESGGEKVPTKAKMSNL